MTRPLFSWIHISDVHVGHGDASHRWDQRLVLHALCADIAAVCNRDGDDADEVSSQSQHHPDVVPDAMFVTGDVAFSGQAEQYQNARMWLTQIGHAAGLGPEHIYVVPGNHDVDRTVDSERDVRRLVNELRADLTLDEALAHAGDRAKLAARLGAYLDFAAGFAPACNDPDPGQAAQRLYWQHRDTYRTGLQVRVVGLNTALLSADDGDHGRLALGTEQLARTIAQPTPGPHELVIALSHHPLRAGWLGDERTVLSWVRNRVHVYLSGHVHDAASQDARAGTGRGLLNLTAGAAHGEAAPAGVPPRHGYAIGAVYADDQGRLSARIWPRLWSPGHAGFVVDVHNVPSGQAYAEHALDLTLPRPRADVSAAQPRPRYAKHIPRCPKPSPRAVVFAIPTRSQVAPGKPSSARCKAPATLPRVYAKSK